MFFLLPSSDSILPILFPGRLDIFLKLPIIKDEEQSSTAAPQVWDIMRSEDRETNRHFPGVAVVFSLRSSDVFFEVFRTDIVTVKVPI